MDREIEINELFRDVGKEKEQSGQIQFLSHYDPLTGLFNKDYLEAAMNRLDTEENLPISIIMSDIDGLKITNSVFGQKKGDLLLRQSAMSLRKNCRSRDLIARWSSEEFVVFMAGTSLAEAEKIIRRIKNDPLSGQGSGLGMCLSLGCAAKERREKSLQEVMREAGEYRDHQKLLDRRSYRSGIISTLLAMLYEKSVEAEEHGERLGKHCRALGKKLQLSSKEMDELSLLALFHDIGKLAIHPNILQKPGPLTSEEWQEMKRHSEIGCRIAQAAPELGAVASLILSHHEHWDGKGYPRGLKEEEIPLACRILAVTDAYDAMTNDRVYRKAVSKEEAVRELARNAGTQFDPRITELFIETVRTQAEAAERIHKK
ncbi:MAG: diguanylate cyclase [Peptococcaceae bacterium]|nr:diguanylate cyclase [Peptococcaceae bacterium]